MLIASLIGHPPITPGREADATYLGPGRQSRSFELLGHESFKELPEPVLYRLSRILLAEGKTGQGKNPFCAATVSEEVIEKEIVQFIRSHQIFGQLRDLVGIRGNKFRTNGCFQHCAEHLGQCGAGAMLRIPADQVGDHGLGHAGVNIVIRHVISIEGAPAERQLAQIAGAGDDAASLIGMIEQDLSAFSRLGILIDHIVVTRM